RPNVGRRRRNRVTELRTDLRRSQLLFRHAHGLAIEPVELARVLHQRAIAALAHGLQDRTHDRFRFRKPRGFARQQTADIFALEYSNHSTILLSGYSTMPS